MRDLKADLELCEKATPGPLKAIPRKDGACWGDGSPVYMIFSPTGSVYKGIDPVTRRKMWVDEQIYEVKDQFPLGHGEKSLYILRQFVDLTEEEALAIRWHMGPFTADVQTYSGQQTYNRACALSPLVPLLFTADFEATHLLEKEEAEK